MKFFQITPAGLNKTLDWPQWLQVAWERDFGEKSAFEPSRDEPGVYIARDSRGNEAKYLAGDIIQATAIA